tara:strand:- start:747 stop:1367 length:621 start_codon:yes stop_codon:yes gene_type:complete
MSKKPPPTQDYCEVYAEPRHRFHLRNSYTNIYEIELPDGCLTQFHRHTEDTVYFVIADACVEESFLDKPSKLTSASFGGTLCRSHHGEPLIHQVRNIGKNTMHMIGAEALLRPPGGANSPLSFQGYTQEWESSRFRLYGVHTSADLAPVTFEIYGLLVSLIETTISIKGSIGSSTLKLAPGSFVWIEPPCTLHLGTPFRGLFAEWI